MEARGDGKSVLFINGKILGPPADGLTTSQSAEPDFSSCMLISGSVITYVGNDVNSAEVSAARDAGAEVRDLGRKTVLPGFIDCHMHLFLLGLSLTKLDLYPCRSLDDIRAAVTAYASANPHVPRILCKGWMHSMTGGQALASMLHGLDGPAIAAGNAERPIYIDAKDLHSTWCNDSALAELGVMNAADAPDPPGGTIHRDADGKATGLLSESCVFNLVVPYLARATPLADRVAFLGAAFDAYSAAGYTGLVDMAMDRYAWEALSALRAQRDGQLSVRVAAYWLISPAASSEEELAQVECAAEMARPTHSSADVRVVGIKLISDGVVDACTAHLLAPYRTGVPSPPPLWTPERLAPVVARASEHGLSVAIHAIGDGAVHDAVNVLESHARQPATGSTLEDVTRASWRWPRHRIEHLELAGSSDAARIARLGVTASIQPVHADPAILRAWPTLLDAERCRGKFPYRTLVDAGARIAIGTDSPTAPWDVWGNLFVASTRMSAREAGAGPDTEADGGGKPGTLGLGEAIRAATHGAAWSVGDEGRVGELRVGMEADFVVVDMEWDPEKLLQASVTETWSAGRMVWAG